MTDPNRRRRDVIAAFVAVLVLTLALWLAGR